MTYKCVYTNEHIYTYLCKNTFKFVMWLYNKNLIPSNARNLSVYLSLTEVAKILCLPYYACVFSSTKLEIRAEQVLPGSKGGEGERVRVGDRGENDPNKVCTCE
jgi:hypothetical protein